MNGHPRARFNMSFSVSSPSYHCITCEQRCPGNIQYIWLNPVASPGMRNRNNHSNLPSQCVMVFLTTSNIILSHLQSPEFAFLSACCNKAIPLVAAMRLSGFRSVIGYMRSVNENVAGQISSALYNYFVDGDLGGLERCTRLNDISDSSSHDV